MTRLTGIPQSRRGEECIEAVGAVGWCLDRKLITLEFRGRFPNVSDAIQGFKVEKLTRSWLVNESPFQMRCESCA